MFNVPVITSDRWIKPTRIHLPKNVIKFPPLPGGEGRGEGKRKIKRTRGYNHPKAISWMFRVERSMLEVPKEAKPERISALGFLSDFGRRLSDFPVNAIHQTQLITGPARYRFLMMLNAELLGVGSDALEKLKLLQNPACAFGNGAQGVIGDMHRQAGFLGDQPVNAAQ